MSPRQEVFAKISEFISNNNLDAVYSGSGLSQDKKYRYVLISRPRYLDGEIKIYGPKFIQVQYQTALRSLPHNDSRIFQSADNCLEFLRLAFVEHRFKDALGVPTK